jgi:hypothetical protein
VIHFASLSPHSFEIHTFFQEAPRRKKGGKKKP